MGHTDVSITLNTYTSVFNKYKEAELEKVNNYYMNNCIIQPTQQFLEESNNIKNQELLPLNDIATKQQPLSNSKNDYSISEKRKKIQELYSMIGSAVSKGTIPVSEYLENLEYLQKMEQKLCEEEEKGEIER